MHCLARSNLIAEYDLERPKPNEPTPLFWARIFSLQNVNIRLIRFHRPCAFPSSSLLSLAAEVSS